jgi:signal transduction histidine kinase
MNDTIDIDILLVEDNPADIFLVKKMLHATSLQINRLYTTDKVMEAREALKSLHFHVALLDLSLPDSFGIETYLEIKSYVKAIPVIILTGLNDANIAIEALKQGAQDYLVKGEFTSDLLYRAIQYSLERKRVEEALLISEKKLNEQQRAEHKKITAAVFEALESDRAHLGGELHDNINQMLATAMLYLEHAKTNVEEKDEMIDKSLDVLALTIAEIRKLSRKLIVSDINEIGLEKAIREMIESITLVKKKKISLHMVNILERRLNYNLKTSIYRIIQEQLTNILKHADASIIDIELKKEEEIIILKIGDNGKGFDTTLQRKGVGITNIISRVSLYDGEVTIDSAPGRGCILKATLQLKNK